jgi:hypothetical protein
MQGYCVKCKTKREMKSMKIVSMKGKGKVKRQALTGNCPQWGTKMFRIMGKEQAEEMARELKKAA